ncbi:SET domain-containing protein-lysine N-methyltransferase [Flavisolibacter ginsenosidimutans]|uniref:SET domain-containing protein n=1 Tax=Flavisolibacter ginsenosidimutans TaxID=661481 RepID=A0A5B8UKQ1_9BACT|nr:SET domain-containing protein-lysine N-methyltransferase [Flavisolibacter ginsenosidimutans]QEC57267.1 SET domain-containing protein [Flavisolibacter ginsenosidimutans]
MNDKRKIINRYEAVSVEESLRTGQRSLHASKAFQKDEIISSFAAAEERSSPTSLTLQKDDNVHIVLSPSFLQYVNHSCSPSAFFDTTLMQFVALKNIAEGEELTFFYPSAEWEMAQAFDCRCGHHNCLGTISGAAFLSTEVLQRYRLTDFIQRKLAEQKEKRA